MNCHNERMIKIRKHAQKKAEREKANGGSGSSRTRDHEAKNAHREQERSDEPSRSSSSRSQSTAPSSRTDNSRPPETFRSPAKPIQGPYVSDAFEAKPPPPYSHSQSQANGSTATLSPQLRPPSPSQSPSVTVAPPDLETARPPSHPSMAQIDAPHKSNTLPIPPASSSSDFKRRSSYDDGVRPLNVLLKQDSLPPEKNGLQLPSEGLSVTSRRDKRRSINPGLSFSPFKDAVPNQLSPRQTSFQPEQTASVPYPNGHDQSYSAPSSKQPSRPSSRSSSVHSSLSSHPDLEQYYRPRSPSIRSGYSPDDTIIMTSPPTMTVELESSQDTPRSHEQPSNDSGLYNRRTSATLSPVDPNGFHSQRRISSVSSLSSDRRHIGSRSASPSYRADVPQNVESGTDTDPENETDSTSRQNYDASPPAPPPKDIKDSMRIPNLNLPDGSVDLDSPEISQFGDISDDMGESVERMSHTTYIAPALPPIRFSMDTADFAELLGSVGGAPSLKHLDNLAKLTKQGSTPSSSEASQKTSKNRQSALTNGVRNESDVRYSNSSTLSGVPEERGSSDEHGNTLLSDKNRAATPTTREERTTTNSRRVDLDADLVLSKLREALTNAKEKGAQQIKVDIGFVDAIVEHLASRDTEYYRLKNRVDGMNRESKLFIDGMTVAQVEYDRELKARRDAEAEVTRLRVLLSGQAVRLTTLSGDSRRQELRQQLSKELNDNLSGLEQDLSRLKVERDVALAEMEELSSKRSLGSPTDIVPTNLGRSLTKRLETIRNQYQRELVPLTEQKESLSREIAELKAVRDVFLEETTVLNARNEELAQLSAVYARRIENTPETPVKDAQEPSQPQQLQTSFDTPRPQLLAPSLSSSTSGSSTAHDETQESRYMRAPRSETDLHTPAKPKFKWPGSKAKELVSPSPSMETSKGKAHIEHNFQQLSVLRFTRCDHCGDKMWGSQLRCTVCSTSIHVRCIVNVQIPCSQHNGSRDESQAPLPPSMFGRNLIEQVQADSRGEERQIPVIVEKCIEAVEARALDYEGIYRKTGGSGQSKAITQMFERGDYDSFDLCDSDRFNDICSVTSVLKTYFRTLPVPLLTFDLHDQFMAAIAIRDPSLKHQSLVDLVDKLPNEHYFTLRMLMLHLNRVRERSEKNLMNGRNLGVVFGPTLLRSRDPGAEFSDMAGKALFVEWLVDNAPAVFNFSE